jgi:hypothetical protein
VSCANAVSKFMVTILKLICITPIFTILCMLANAPYAFRVHRRKQKSYRLNVVFLRIIATIYQITYILFFSSYIN